jgi:hypothetical protein
MPDFTTIEDHRFLVDTLSHAERALDLDDLWTMNVSVLKMTSDDRLPLLGTVTETQALLVDVARRIDHVLHISGGLDPRPVFSHDNPALERIRDLVGASDGLTSMDSIYAACVKALTDWSDVVAEELPLLSAKVARLANGETLDFGDFTKRTRALLICVVCVVTVAIAATVGHAVATASVAYIAWRAATALCAGVSAAQALKGAL